MSKKITKKVKKPEGFWRKTYADDTNWPKEKLLEVSTSTFDLPGNVPNGDIFWRFESGVILLLKYPVEGYGGCPTCGFGDGAEDQQWYRYTPNEEK